MEKNHLVLYIQGVPKEIGYFGKILFSQSGARWGATGHDGARRGATGRNGAQRGATGRDRVR